MYGCMCIYVYVYGGDGVLYSLRRAMRAVRIGRSRSRAHEREGRAHGARRQSAEGASAGPFDPGRVDSHLVTNRSVR